MCGRFGVRRRSTLSCCRRTRFSASSVALALKREARIPSISLNRSVIRMRAYAVRLLRLDESNFRYPQLPTTETDRRPTNNEPNKISHPQQHRPILGQLLVRLSLRQGQASSTRSAPFYWNVAL